MTKEKCLRCQKSEEIMGMAVSQCNYHRGITKGRKEVIEEIEMELDKEVRYSKMLTNDDYERGFEKARRIALEVVEEKKRLLG